MRIDALFPTPVGVFELGRTLRHKERTFISSLDFAENMSNQTSVNRDVLSDPSLADLRMFIQQSVEEYFQATTCPKTNVSNRILQSWVNRTTTGRHHHTHYHPNSFLSGSFYIESNPDDSVVFESPHQPAFLSEPKQFNIFNAPTWRYPATPGQLILFPSSLWHHVPVVTGGTPRITLSFNTFLKGVIGGYDNMNELIL